MRLTRVCSASIRVECGAVITRLFLCYVIICTTLLQTVESQDLAPRAYIITPVHSNAVTLTYSFYSGNLDVGNIPITDATAHASIPVLSYFHSMGLFKRSANLVIFLPYGIGNFRGSVLGTETNVYRSGLLDSVYRLSINLKGGPAMNVEEYRGWTQKTIIGISLRAVAPTGQYDFRRLINWGNNRWAFKPELGLSQRWGNWIVDSYGGAWVFTADSKFFSANQYNPGVLNQTQAPVGAFEGHVSYDVHPRLWASLDGNFWFGGKTRVGGTVNPGTELQNSRIGTTVSAPLSKHQSLKVSYSRGAYIKYGGNYQNVSIGWQYSWLGRPN